jgi:N-methylhydantoinase B
VIGRDNRHRYTVLAKAHLADCGNAVPTTYVADARDAYTEGALIYPCVRVQREYQDLEDPVRMARVRIRVPELWYGDYLALLGAARIGERRILDLIDESGDDLVCECERAWLEYSERMMGDAIRRLPGGTAVRRGRHDPVPGAADGVEIAARMTSAPREPRITVDLRDNPACMPCALNLTEATAKTAAMVGVFTALGGVVPPNAGSFRCLTVELRQNCVVGIPVHRYSCSAATTNLAELVANLVTAAIAESQESRLSLSVAPALGTDCPSSGR